MNHPARPGALPLEFETERLHMRPLRADDESLFCDLYTDAESMRFIGPALSMERAAHSFRKAVAASMEYPLQQAFLTILEKTTRRPLGICAIVGFDKGMTRAEVGIMIRFDARARGYAREGLGGLVGRTFSAFPVDEIRVECSAKSPLVERMVSSIGFKLRNGMAIGKGPLLQRIWSIHRSS